MEAARAIAAGEGPVAIDAERASGYRYGQRAYLVQLRREGSGTWLIDPIACPDLSPVDEAIGDAEWILHAATQDLACLAEVGLRPRAAVRHRARRAPRWACPGSGSPPSSSTTSACSLAKEHSAVDWSTRPLPEPWLRYAALDVEVLVDVRNADGRRPGRPGQGRVGRARSSTPSLDFTGPPAGSTRGGAPPACTASAAAASRPSCASCGRPATRSPSERDVSPGRVLPDAVARRGGHPGSPRQPRRPGRRPTRGRPRRYQRQWLAAVRRANALPEAELPPLTLRADGPPPARAWADRDPVAGARLAQARATLAAFAAAHSMPVENLLSPDPLRRVLWTPARARRPRGRRGGAARARRPALADRPGAPRSSSRSSRRTRSRSRADRRPSHGQGPTAHRPRWWQRCYS